MHKYKSLIFSVSNWFIIFLIAWLWVQFLWSSNDSRNSEDLKVNSSKVSGDNDPIIGSIAKYHIFGSAEKLYDLQTTQSNTSLEFTLIGTMSNTDEKTGMAFIGNNQSIQKKFRVGDEVFEQATLKEVHKTYIILSHNGKNERLSLPDSKYSPPKRNVTSKNRTAQPAYMKHLNGAAIKNAQELMAQQQFDPGKISSIVSNIKPMINQAGEIKGLRVSNLAAGNLLSKHGLKSNDIITEINGNKVSGNNLLTIQETLKTNPNASITFKRNGKIQNIQINITDF